MGGESIADELQQRLFQRVVQVCWSHSRLLWLPPCLLALLGCCSEAGANRCCRYQSSQVRSQAANFPTGHKSD